MILDWFDAREAIEVGRMLADHYRTRGGSPPSVRAGTDSSAVSPAALHDLLQHAARETRAIKLNAFKRAKLLNSFKWRLRERGVEQNEANEVTQIVFFQLYGSSAKLGAPVAAEALNPNAAFARRITSLLSEADGHFAAGRRAETVASLRRVLRIDPDHPFAHAKLGAALCHLGEYLEAERMLRRAVELDGRNVEALVILGLTLGARSRLDDARDCFAKALALKPMALT